MKTDFDEGTGKRSTHCKACDAEFNTYHRTVLGPNGNLSIEEDLCGKCRRTILLFGNELESDAEMEAREAAEALIGGRNEASTD